MHFKALKFLVVLMTFLAANRVFATDLSFNQLACHSTISSDFKVDVSETSVALDYRVYGQKLHPLLEAVWPEAEPIDLLRSYRCVKLTVELPRFACLDSEGGNGSFLCSFESNGGEFAAVKISARVSCYDDDADTYVGVAQSMSLASVIDRREGRSYYRVLGSITLRDRPHQPVEFVTDNYKAHNWDYDGIRQPPECRIDGAAIVF
jgi:hypothetical protein